MAGKPLFRPIKGSARRYIGPGGKEYSRRQRDNYFAQQAGFQNRAQVEKTRLWVNRNQKDWVKRVITNKGSVTWDDYHSAAEVRRLRLQVADGRTPTRPWEFDSESPELVAPDGPLANYLDAAGIRSKNGKPVGSS